MSNTTMREDAIAIWKAGVEAVKPHQLIRSSIQCDGQVLTIDHQKIDLSRISKIAVVGAGKASAAMAESLESVLGDDLLEEKKVHGWINVPADCMRPLKRIHLHAARPASVNEPTEDGVYGAKKILHIVSQCCQEDLVICLISGGGSALLPCPVEAITLSEKQKVTRFLSASGANINELNTVRKRLSLVKGGQLAIASKAGLLVSLIISDVIGDPLDIIASGLTAEDKGNYQDARDVLDKFSADPEKVSASLLEFISHKASEENSFRPEFPTNVFNHVIGNNRVASAAAHEAAEERGYQVLNLSSFLEGQAVEVGAILSGIAHGIRDTGLPLGPPACILSGGEPVVSLVAEGDRGLGGRNQELVLGAVQNLWLDRMRGMVILSGGTDGEDGPTDAAGAIADESLIRDAQNRFMRPDDFLQRNDSYHFFEPFDALVKTGPTHTNVMDLRVILIK